MSLSVNAREFSVNPSALIINPHSSATFSVAFEPYKEKTRHHAEISVDDVVRHHHKKIPISALAYFGEAPPIEQTLPTDPAAILGKSGSRVEYSSESGSSSTGDSLHRRKRYFIKI